MDEEGRTLSIVSVAFLCIGGVVILPGLALIVTTYHDNSANPANHTQTIRDVRVCGIVLVCLGLLLSSLAAILCCYASRCRLPGNRPRSKWPLKYLHFQGSASPRATDPHHNPATLNPVFLVDENV